jgi:YCII-related domain-containing protein
MDTFVFAYRMPNNYIPGSAETRAAWTSWFESMGADVVDIGKPVFERSALGNCPSDTSLGGYSIVSADDLEAAVALAKGCPVLQAGGGVEVGVLAELPS